MTLPANLPQFIEAGLRHATERHRYSPLISQAEFDLIRLDEDFVQIVPEDSMNFEKHMVHLCRLFNRFKRALDRSSSEAAIPRAVDDLFELAFETDPNALVNSSYLVESKVHVVKYDERRLSHGPSAVATAGGAVLIPLPTQVVQTLRTGGVVYAGPDLHEEYILSFVEYKGGLSNNGRQAILDSAAMQAVNRALGLGVKNYAFSVHHAKVDIITSWWDHDSVSYRYRFKRRNDKFTLDTPIGWFRFYSFLCRLRVYHHAVRDALRVASPSTLLTARELFHLGKLSSIQEHIGGGNNEGSRPGSEGSRPGSAPGEAQDAENGIALGDDAFMFREISVDKFCQGDDSEEDEDDGDASDEDAVPGDARAKVQPWQKSIASPFIIDLPLPLRQYKP
ncbi:hypothetical protein C8F04DRAFT_720364 [Mycena alexandri]|uniref:Uncharacterized protein n=1 Tax=Mycena alexandri TaxID=1745969 RepID=A0AAD6TBH9_9AGAR|nr:hypothetical protein C8F04DRAFT_720364 [Mycena alexandri]